MPKTVLITGAGTGFGRMAAVQLAARGHKVIAAVLNEQQKAELSKAEPKLQVVKLDITDAKDVASVDGYDFDVFIANAAIGQTGPLSPIGSGPPRRAVSSPKSACCNRRCFPTPAPPSPPGARRWRW
jgi:NAD(P)-dependent dehydrogenase (short-subunit alcohol dehydrogenase family)